jgi:hypothetical protein
MEIALPETEEPSRGASGEVTRRLRLTRSWRHRWPIAVRYAAAILLVGLAWTITFALRRSVDAPSFQTPFFVCAIVLSGWIGGAGPGLVATLLSIFAIEFTFTEPRFTFGLTLSEIPKFTVFFLTNMNCCGGFARPSSRLAATGLPGSLFPRTAKSSGRLMPRRQISAFLNELGLRAAMAMVSPGAPSSPGRQFPALLAIDRLTFRPMIGPPRTM